MEISSETVPREPISDDKMLGSGVVRNLGIGVVGY